MTMICPICGEVMKYVSQHDYEVPSEEPRIVSEYECLKCQTRISVSTKC